MSFVGSAIASVFSGISSAASSVASFFAPTATTATTAASGAAAGAATSASAAATSSGFLGLGSGFWTALGVGFTALSTINTINSNNQMARAAIFDTAMQREAAEIDYARRRSDVRRETERETARRTSLLSATGGLVDGAD